MRYGDEVVRATRAARWVGIVVVVAVLTVACRGADTSAGTMLRVLHDQATVDGDAVADGDAIPPRATVATDPDGVARFRLTASDLRCHMFQGAVVDLLDTESVLRFQRGVTFCTAAAGSELKVETEQFDLTFTDARFGVDLAGDEPAVLIEEGRMAVESFAGAERRPVDTAIVQNDDDPPDEHTLSDPNADQADTDWEMTVVVYRPGGRLDVTERRVDPDSPGALFGSRQLSSAEIGALRWLQTEQLLQVEQPSRSPSTGSATDAVSDAPITPADVPPATGAPSEPVADPQSEGPAPPTAQPSAASGPDDADDGGGAPAPADDGDADGADAVTDPGAAGVSELLDP